MITLYGGNVNRNVPRYGCRVIRLHHFKCNGVESRVHFDQKSKNIKGPGSICVLLLTASIFGEIWQHNNARPQTDQVAADFLRQIQIVLGPVLGSH
ncbi:hypothetical protein TNIN_476051 [Trichonephila inaurata madagascariensis]|uniref:Uncharacterized protein n=1 Tax=Trichonephila inaurata madagascariensis TaxID=2747483 RepID=A0A8X6M5M6_9ARAC|nr:hypothetical protein TNIN_476051 [Trichonephila inaurata madagascariensis]